MIAGLVTNCFRHQLDAGESLLDLIAEAERRGYRAIELRQGSLGEFESDDQNPDAQQLTELPSRFPDVRFNIAVQFPFLSPGVDPHDAVFSAGKWAAQAVSGEAPPHLRLVDLTTTDEQLAEADRFILTENLIRLVAAMAEIDGVLSIENGPQNWPALWEVFDSVRDRGSIRRGASVQGRDFVSPDAHRLMLCYDPCNLLMNDANPDPATVTGGLIGDDISLFHFKQRRDGAILPTVCDGDLDWPAQVALLSHINYAGPGLFEVMSSESIWEALDESTTYLNNAGLAFDQA